VTRQNKFWRGEGRLEPNSPRIETQFPIYVVERLIKIDQALEELIVANFTKGLISGVQIARWWIAAT